MKTCKNCEWAGNCAWDDNAVMCKYYMEEHGEYIPANKVVKEAEKCLEYCEVKKVKYTKCNGTGIVEPLTNEEWFDSLSTETKARITHLVYMAGYRDGCNRVETLSLQDIMKWLKQPHKERSDTYGK